MVSASQANETDQTKEYAKKGPTIHRRLRGKRENRELVVETSLAHDVDESTGVVLASRVDPGHAATETHSDCFWWWYGGSGSVGGTI